jgi:hypothetical protein
MTWLLGQNHVICWEVAFFESLLTVPSVMTIYRVYWEESVILWKNIS